MLDFDRFDTLTFDCYGTLIDWEQGMLSTIRPLLSRHGIEMGDTQILELYGKFESEAERGLYRSYRHVLASVIDGFGQELGFTLSPAERAALAASLGDWPPFPDTVEALQSLARRFRLAIISNVDDDLFAGSARQLQVGFEFAAVITAQQVGSYKPDPRNFLYAFERLGTTMDRVLHVAQSQYHDIVPARKMGLTVVWVNRQQGRAGATPRASAQPDLEVPNLATLAQMISS